MISKLLKLILFFIICSLFSCSKNENEYAEIVENDINSGGSATTYIQSSNAFTIPPSGLNADEIAKHLLGDGAFDQTFVTYPSNQAGGLGPNYNQNSCVACHVRNGRANPPQFENDLASGLLFRISLPGFTEHNEAINVPGFGTQLQTKAIFGVQPEGKIKISYTPITENFEDGNFVTLQKPTYTITDTYVSLPSNVLISARNAPPVFGLGLIDAIEERSILAFADENDDNQDGISGKPNYSWDYETNSVKLGRFGLKASSYSLLHQTASAYNQDMGITSYLFQTENCFNQSNCVDGLNPNFDVDNNTMKITTFYTKSLGVPARRNVTNNSVKNGKQIFNSLDCVKCHIPKVTTGISEIASLSNQIIFPYSDFLLHDMGDELADKRTDFLANGNEWKTPPLWGIGLTKIVNPKAQFLHDGRAKTIEEAILWHGGEGLNAKNKYKKLSLKDRNDLLAYINSL